MTYIGIETGRGTDGVASTIGLKQQDNLKGVDLVIPRRNPLVQASGSTSPYSKWAELFASYPSAERERELFYSTLLNNGKLPQNNDLFFPVIRDGAWSIIALDEQFAYKLVVGKRRKGVYEGYDEDRAKLLVDEYHRYSELLSDAGIQIPSQRSIDVVCHPIDKDRVYLYEVQERIPGVNGLSLLRPNVQGQTLITVAQQAIFEQSLMVLLPILKNPSLSFGLDPHPANFIYDPENLTKAPIFIDLLPPRPSNGIDYQENLRLSADAFYRRRLHLLYEPAGLVKYLYNSFAVADPNLSGDFEKLTLVVLQQNGVLYEELAQYFNQDNVGERLKDWGYMQRIFMAIGRSERAQSFKGNSTHLSRLPYYFIPKPIVSDQRLDELGCRSNFWPRLIQEYLGDSWSNIAVASIGTDKPQISINMTIDQKRILNLPDRVKDFERFKKLATGAVECVITIGHPLTVSVFDKIKEICSGSPVSIKVVVNKSPKPNISRDLATAVSTGEVRFVLDDDCYVPNETFVGLYEKLVGNDQFIAVGTSSVNPDGTQHKPEEDFPSERAEEGLLVSGIHGMAFMIKAQYMDQYPIPPRIGKRGDWLPFFSLLQNENGICVYDFSLPPIQHRFEVSDNNFSISRRRLAGLHAILSMMHTLYETGDLLISGSRADSYLRDHYLGETLEGAKKATWLPILWKNLQAICTGDDSFLYSTQEMYDRMTQGILSDDLGIKNSLMLRWAGKLYLRNKVLVEGSKKLMLELTSNQLLPPFHKFNQSSL